MANLDDSYRSGAIAALDAIAEGFPRWMHTDSRPFGQMIDPDTGLPLFGLSGPAELSNTNEAIVRGYNDTISDAIKAGEVTVDFRPLLMTRIEAIQALKQGTLGTLSTGNPRISAPCGEFILELRFPRPTVKRPSIWISYSRGDERWPDFALYEEPEEVAIGQNGKVLVFRSSRVILTRDVETTQVLNSYLV